MRLVSTPRFTLALRLVLLAVPLACSDDGGGETGAETGPVSSTGASSSTTAASDEGTSTSTGTIDSSGSTAATSSDDGNTTGSTGDPNYPPMVGGTCPADTLPVMLPGAALCAPFCGGPAAECPAAASGDAVPVCTPFAGQGGSGDACDDAIPCPDGEICSEGACADIPFFACQLSCAMDETCPDGMACSGIATCGYP